ncbi:hypothetical protein B0H66DRAFT_278820 [Apodospora peruviana]|uniref:Uncharacterized protein n=1 Tax=Apodospora peruviana TaxID=516989 RepID=A0AAE0I0F6_9PEZI|nr:hypothetical protein B0H66DRAFT_278820 [Apodospora peruviana]
MQRWASSSTARFWRTAPRVVPRRLFGSVQRIKVSCASSGSITVSLHNISEHRPTAPLMVYIPPFPQETDGYRNKSDAVIPSWLRQYPTAVINYRWDGLFSDIDSSPPRSSQSSSSSSSAGAALHNVYWPTPIHDVLFGYSWIVQNLGAPPLSSRNSEEPTSRRDLYVCSSYLGASLAAGLALTESHWDQPTAVRGLINFNGIYNWTTFLPDHPINRLKEDESSSSSSLFSLLEQQAPALFQNPDNLFDPFASACLFFHSASLHVPPDFHTPLLERPSSGMTKAIDALSSISSSSSSDSSSSTSSLAMKPPRKGYLTFPPRNSTLKLPSALLLHETTPPSHSPRRKGKGKAGGTALFGGSYSFENSFKTQAHELAGLMRRSINMFELRRERISEDYYDGQIEGFGSEAEERVQVADVGGLIPRASSDGNGTGQQNENDDDEDGFGLNELGQEMVAQWLHENM